jgi:hypothetical protein
VIADKHPQIAAHENHGQNDDHPGKKAEARGNVHNSLQPRETHSF